MQYNVLSVISRGRTFVLVVIKNSMATPVAVAFLPILVEIATCALLLRARRASCLRLGRLMTSLREIVQILFYIYLESESLNVTHACTQWSPKLSSKFNAKKKQ